jgi:hypothetical protein
MTCKQIQMYRSTKMRRRLAGGVFLLLMFLFSGSCTHDPVIPVTPEVSFSKQVRPIFVNNCARAGCHDGNEFALQSYSEIRAHVTPGDARKSKLYKSIVTLWGPGGAMPPDGPLSDQQINLIYAWIMQGAKNN